jgi:hypothetical protein
MNENSTAREQIATQTIRSELSRNRPDLSPTDLEKRAEIILRDVELLARCAISNCLITYADAIELRGHGNPQNGQWLDEAYANAIAPFGFPDLTMLVVNRATKQPSPDAFEARRTILSGIHVDDIPAEQKRCFWHQTYEDVLGELEPVPNALQLVRILTPQSPTEREIARAVGNAINRVALAGVEQVSYGKEYPQSLPRPELAALVRALWALQNGRCALTGQPFELRTDEEGGQQEDRISLDRIDNSIGYAADNVQLVTQFANRARGTLSVDEARHRLVQIGEPGDR